MRDMRRAGTSDGGAEAISRTPATPRSVCRRGSYFGVVLLVATLCACAPTRRELPTVDLDVARFPQPTLTSAGPTSLRMVLAYYGMTVPHDEMLEVLPVDQLGAVRGPQVGLAALRCGFRVAIIPYEHRVLRPSWSTLPTAALVEQLEQVGGPASTAAIRDGQPLARLYADYVRAGGLLRFAPLSRELLISYLEERTPLIAALDTEYLYATAAPGAPRDAPRQAQFIVVGGYDAGTDEFAVSDPWYDIPLANSGGRYRVRSDRLVTAILLGAEGDHAGLVAIRPR